MRVGRHVISAIREVFHFSTHTLGWWNGFHDIGHARTFDAPRNVVNKLRVSGIEKRIGKFRQILETGEPTIPAILAWTKGLRLELFHGVAERGHPGIKTLDTELAKLRLIQILHHDIGFRDRVLNRRTGQEAHATAIVQLGQIARFIYYRSPFATLCSHLIQKRESSL